MAWRAAPSALWPEARSVIVLAENYGPAADPLEVLEQSDEGTLLGRRTYRQILIAYALASGGLIASTFHLGHPERAIKAFTQWRSSWLSREAWLADGKPPHPGRLNDLRHIIYKKADEPWRRARRRQPHGPVLLQG